MNIGEIVVGVAGFFLGALVVLTYWNVCLIRHRQELHKRMLEAKDLWI